MSDRRPDHHLTIMEIRQLISIMYPTADQLDNTTAAIISHGNYAYKYCRVATGQIAGSDLTRMYLTASGVYHKGHAVAVAYGWFNY